MNKTVLQVLVDARNLIRLRKNWTQGVSARGKSGRKVDARSKKAVAFCAMGAIERASGPDTHMGAVKALMMQIYGFVSSFNDKHQHREVLALFDKAIAGRRR